MSNRKLLKNFTSLGVVQIANYIFPLISLPVYSRIIGPDKFGVISYAAVFVGYFNILIGYGFDLSATRQISRDPENPALRNRVFSEVFSAQLLLLGVSAVLFIGCLLTIRPLAVEKTVAVYSFLVCIGTLFSQIWLFQAMQDLPKIAILSFIGRLLFTISVLLLVRHKSDYVFQPLLVGLTGILISMVSFYWAYKKYALKFIKIPFKRIRELLWNEKTVFFTTIVISLYTTTNTVMLGLMKSDAEVGYYSAAQRLIDVANSIINIPLAQVLFPFIGYSLGQSRESGILMVQRIFPLIVLVTGVISILMFLFGPIVLNLFYGSAFLPSVRAFQILCWVPMIISVNNVFVVQLMLNLKMDRKVLYICACGGVFGLVLNAVMISFMGYIGTAWNWMIVEIFITLASYIVLRREGLDPIDKKAFRYASIINEVRLLTGRSIEKN